MRIGTKQLSFLMFITIGVLFAIAHGHELHEQDQHITLSSATDFSQIHPGGSGLLAITLHIEDGWHTYWPGVSDSGFGVDLTLNTSESITLEDPIWPTPSRHLQPGDILDHVYEDTATILVRFHIADDAQPDEIAYIDIDADYLVCKDICLPEQASTSTSFTIIAELSKQSTTESSDQIRKLYEHRPKEFNPKAADVRVQWVDRAAAIMFRDATKIEFFPSKACSSLADPIVGGLTESNRLIIEFAESENKIIAGRIRSYEPAGIVDYNINITAPN